MASFISLSMLEYVRDELFGGSTVRLERTQIFYYCENR